MKNVVENPTTATATATTVKFSYVKTDSIKTAKKRMDILNVVNKGGNELKARLQKRSIKIPEIVAIRMHSHNKVNKETSEIKSSSTKFFVKVKDGSEKIINISKFF